MSITRGSQELGLSYGTLWHILHLDLHLHPCKVQLMQQLKPADHSQRHGYVEWVLEQQVVDGNFSIKILFTFPTGGYDNKQNCRIWDSENPQLIEQRPLHPEKAIVWCALLYEGVIGLYFFENDDATTVSVKQSVVVI